MFSQTRGTGQTEERKKNTGYLHIPSSKKVYSGTPESRCSAVMVLRCLLGEHGPWSSSVLLRLKMGFFSLCITIYLTSDHLSKNSPGKLHFKHFPMCGYFQLAGMGKWYHYLGETNFKSCLEHMCLSRFSPLQKGPFNVLPLFSQSVFLWSTTKFTGKRYKWSNEGHKSAKTSNLHYVLIKLKTH